MRVVRAGNREAAADRVVCVSGGAYTCPREAAGVWGCALACARPRGVRVVDARVICGVNASPTRLDPQSFSHLGSPGFAPWMASGRLSCRDSEPVTVANPEQAQQVGCIGVLVFPSSDPRTLPPELQAPFSPCPSAGLGAWRGAS